MCKNILDKEFGLNDWYHKMKLYYIYIYCYNAISITSGKYGYHQATFGSVVI